MLMDRETEKRIREAGVIAVLAIEKKKHVRPTVEALLQGGVRAVELTLRTDIALEAISLIHREYPEILLGVGTILTPEQVGEVKRAGANFGVAPGLNRKVMDAAIEQRLPFAPGIATPSEIESALEYGCRIMKFFPAEPMGGLAYLRSMSAPYAHLGLSFIPLGGISQENLPLYAREKAICGIGGSWLASRALILGEEWQTITAQAESAMKTFFEEKGNG